MHAKPESTEKKQFGQRVTSISQKEGHAETLQMDIVGQCYRCKTGYLPASSLPAIPFRDLNLQKLDLTEPIGTYLDIDKAWRIGLVKKVVPQEELMSAAVEMAEKIGQWPVVSTKYTKSAMARGPGE